MGFQRQKTGVFARLIRTSIVIFLGLALGACAYNPKTGELRVAAPDNLRPGETWYTPQQLVDLWSGAEYWDYCERHPCPFFISRPPDRYAPRATYADLIPVSRWSYGLSIGGDWGKGEMNHFFAPADTNSRIRDVVATASLEYSRAYAYNQSLNMVSWGRAGLDLTTPTSGNSPPNFGGEVLKSHIGWMLYGKVGASWQFLEKNGKTSGIFPMNHCLWMTAGPVIANVRDDFADESHSKTALGWAVAAGFDFNYTPDWTVRLGVQYTDLGKNTVSLPGGPVAVDHTDFSVKLGLFRRFESYAPASSGSLSRTHPLPP
jgi:outer membrane protein with beta-barrel domain